MITPVDDQLRREAQAFSLRFTCEDCAWMDERRTACSLGYPNDEHRQRDLDTATEIVFCKAFELGT